MFVSLTVTMETTNEKLNPEQSLALIATMISQAKGNMEKSSFYFLLWGWTIVVANLGVYALMKFTTYSHPHVMFAITIPAAIVSIIYGIRQGKRAISTTHLDQINKWLWIGFGINCFIFSALTRQIGWMVNPIIILLTAVPTFVTGVMLRFKPLMAGGVIFWVMGVLLFFLSRENQHLVSAVAIALGYLIPGYMLKKSEK